MKRITLNDVEKAYMNTGLKFYNMEYYSQIFTPHKEKCACPIGVLALYCGATNKKQNYELRTNKAYKWAKEEYGLEYICGFIDGISSEINKLTIEKIKYLRILTDNEFNGYLDGLFINQNISKKLKLNIENVD